MTAAPLSQRELQRRQRGEDARLGRDAAVRRCGTFRSSRISTRLPARSRSVMRRMDIGTFLTDGRATMRGSPLQRQRGFLAMSGSVWFSSGGLWASRFLWRSPSRGLGGDGVPCSVFRVPCSVFRVPCSVFRVPCSVFRVPCFVFRVPCSVFRVPCSVFRFVFRVSCFVFRVSCFVFRVSCFVFRVSCFVGVAGPISSFRRKHPASSSRRKPGSSAFLILCLFFVPAKASRSVIPAEAGIHLLFLLIVRRFAKTDSRPCGVPSAILAAGSLSLLAQEKVTKENTPSVPRRRCAPVRYGRPGFCRQAIHGLRQKRRDPSRRPRGARA